MAEMEHLGGKRAESARARRAEQLRRWRGSLTEQEPADRPGAELPPQAQRGGPRVRFEDGAVFLAACSSGDTDEVRRLLARGADVDTANVDGLTALHQVSARGRWPSRLPPPTRGRGPRRPAVSASRRPQSARCPPVRARAACPVPSRKPAFCSPGSESGVGPGLAGLGPRCVLWFAMVRRQLPCPAGPTREPPTSRSLRQRYPRRRRTNLRNHLVGLMLVE